MEQQTQQAREQLRSHTVVRQAGQCPPPSLQEIRRQLGWNLVNRRGDGLRGR